MSLIVQKFGGTSVGSVERLQHVADKVASTKKKGHDVVVVLSAMNGETDRLIQLGNSFSHKPTTREYDALVSTGEQVTSALLSIALNERGVKARSFSGRQAGIVTDSNHKKARIKNIDVQELQQCIAEDVIPVVAGFQGTDTSGNVTTLGRGGSDTTAVAIAASLKATECQVYTDVEGVYTTDPRVVADAKLLNRVTFEEMLELASLGTKILQLRAVELAGKFNVPLRVLSSFTEKAGTLITYEDKRMEQPLVSGIAFDRNQAKLSLLRVPDKPGLARQILGAVSDENIDVDMIVQNVPSDENTIDFSFTVQRDDYQHALEIMRTMAADLKAGTVFGDDRVAKLSLVGVGMRSHPGVATTMFETLGDEGINIKLISTSEIKISVIVDEKYLELGARSLHRAFGLDGKTP